MNKEKTYVISVGRERIEEGHSGTLDRTTMQPAKKQTVSIPVGGYFIPTVTMAWGRRVINGKPRSDGSVVTPLDNDYKGEIEFLPWGDRNGERILCQYLEGCHSLDKTYQEKKLNLLPTNEEGSLLLEQGENAFNYDSDEVKIQFLQISGINRNSKSRDPKLSGGMYREIGKDDTKEQKNVSKLQKSFDAMRIVSEAAATPANLQALFSLLGGKKTFTDINDIKKGSEIFPALFNYANSQTIEFFKKLDEYKKSVDDLFVKAETFHLLDTTIDGTIGLSIDGKKQVILSDVPAKQDDMIVWVKENFYEAKVYEALSRMGELLKKVK